VSNPLIVPTSGIGPIKGVVVTFEAYATGGGSPYVNAQLLAPTLSTGLGIHNNIVFVGGAPGEPVGLSKTIAITATSPGTTYQLGSSTDLWGMTGANVLSAGQVSAQGFGVTTFAYLTALAASVGFYISNIQVTVYWVGGAIGIPWTNPNNITVGSGTYATSTISSGTTTLPLSATEFGYVIPFGFVPSGLEVQCQGYSSASTGVLTAVITYQGAVISLQKSVQLTTSAGTNITFGGPTDLWAISPNTLGVDITNDASFGVAFYVTETTAGATEHLGNVRITVYGTSPYTVELVAYENAELTGLNTYQLTNLKRGIYGSWPTASPAGSTFVRLDQNIIQYKVNPQYRGQNLYFKFCSFNAYGQQLQSLASVPAVIVPILPASSTPGGIDALTGAVTVGTQNNSTLRLDAATNAVQGTYGINTIPQGYGLVNLNTSAPSSTPQWSPVVSAGNGTGTLSQQYIVGDAPVVTSDYTANPWDYVIVDTTAGDIYITLPPANGTIGVTKVEETNIIVSKKNIGGGVIYLVPDQTIPDTIGWSVTAAAGSPPLANLLSIIYQNTTIVMTSDGVSNWNLS